MHGIDALWNKPVTVRLQNGLLHTFHSLEDTIDFLENKWPNLYGTHHRRALDLCRAARMRLTSREAAREAFIAACIEACMPLVLTVPAKEPSPALPRSSHALSMGA